MINSYKKNVPALILFIFLIACSKENSSYIVLNPTHHISEFNDSTFFSDAYGMKCLFNEIYCSDFQNGSVYILDENLNLIKTIGNYGEGPGEMTYCTKVDVNKNYVLASDDGNRRINIYRKSDGSFVSSFKSNSPGNALLTRFAISDDNITYMSSKNAIFAIDLSGNTVNEFKLKAKSNWEKEKKAFSLRNVFIYNDKSILLVPDTEPFIELYSFSGQFIDKFDLSGLKCLQGTIKFVNENYDPSHSSYYVIFQDAYLVNDLLYILYLDITNDGIKSLDKIMVLNISETDFELKKVYKLKTSADVTWYDSFCVSEERKQIIAFEGVSYEIQVFELN